MNEAADSLREAAGAPALRVEGLCKRFGRREVLRDVGFELRAGEILGFLGANARCSSAPTSTRS